MGLQLMTLACMGHKVYHTRELEAPAWLVSVRERYQRLQ